MSQYGECEIYKRHNFFIKLFKETPPSASTVRIATSYGLGGIGVITFLIGLKTQHYFAALCGFIILIIGPVIGNFLSNFFDENKTTFMRDKK